MEVRVVLRTDADPLLDVVEQINARLPLASPALRAEVAQLLFGAGDLGPELACVKADAGPAGTSDLLVRLEPSDRLVMALAALRAGDGDGL